LNCDEKGAKVDYFHLEMLAEVTKVTKNPMRKRIIQDEATSADEAQLIAIRKQNAS